MKPETFRLEILSFFSLDKRDKNKKNKNKTNLELFLLIQFQRRHIPIAVPLLSWLVKLFTAAIRTKLSIPYNVPNGKQSLGIWKQLKVKQNSKVSVSSSYCGYLGT